MHTLSTVFAASNPHAICTPPNRSEQVLRDLPQPLIVLRPDRRLLFVNASAELLLAHRQAGEVEGRLMHLGQLTAPLIEELLRQARAGSGTRAGLWFKGLQTGWLSATRVPYGMASSADWPLDSVLLLIHQDEPRLAHAARVDALCQQCGLTPTERYVLLLLADGLVAQDVARQLAVQLSTVRTHIRNLLSKTGSPSLMQLLRQLGSTQPLETCPWHPGPPLAGARASSAAHLTFDRYQPCTA
jgi:DNA-binding CsgD family transcriptional regulator